MNHLYRTRYRPPSFATLPVGLQWDFVEMPPDIAHRRPELPQSSRRFGVIATTRALTSDELERFEIEVHASDSCGEAHVEQPAVTSQGASPCEVDAELDARLEAEDP